MADGTEKQADVPGRARWITPAMRADRKARALPYYNVEGGLEELHERGAIDIKPQGTQVLLRAIVPEVDCSDLSVDSYNARLACAHEVLKIGPGAAKWWAEQGTPEEDRLRVGQHVFVVSAAANRLSKTDPSVRLWSTAIEDICQVWDPPRG